VPFATWRQSTCPLDKQRAAEFYRRCGVTNLYAVKGLARIALTSPTAVNDIEVAKALAGAAESGDAESAWYLAYMYHEGKGVPRDPQKATANMSAACKLKMTAACAMASQSSWPAYKNPQPMVVPGWSTAFPTH
jgi:TPR repeat protein